MSKIIDRAYFLRAKIEQMSQNTITEDAEALDYSELFPNWDGNRVKYTVGLRVRYNGVLYKVWQEHVSQETWNPVEAPSLFAEVLIPDPGVIPEWKQPESTNGYAKGDKVTHNGKTWESQVDNNVWEPGVGGTESLWFEVTG